MIKFLYELPMISQMKDDEEAEWRVGVYEGVNACEFMNEDTGIDCVNARMFFGTTDSREPKFCARHFFSYIHGKDGQSKFIA